MQRRFLASKWWIKVRCAVRCEARIKMRNSTEWIPDASRWVVYSYVHYSIERFSSERSLPVDRLTSWLEDEVKNNAIRKIYFERSTIPYSRIQILLVYSLVLFFNYTSWYLLISLARKAKSIIVLRRQIPKRAPFNEFRWARNTLRDSSSALATLNSFTAIETSRYLSWNASWYRSTSSITEIVNRFCDRMFSSYSQCASFCRSLRFLYLRRISRVLIAR